jgi:uncharacterized membrane protein SpoIIM required for sporulation
VEYAAFVRIRGSLWDAFEDELRSAREAPRDLRYAQVEALALHYRQVLHDHALATARFPGTGAARRLQRLALEGTHWLRWERSDRVAGPVRFLTEIFPRSCAAVLPHVAAAGGLFLVALLFGFALSVAQPAVGLGLLGPGAVASLKEGRLWTESLTTVVPPEVSSSGIATNNMSVALTGWAGGALCGTGALYVVLMNGFLLGAVLAATLHYSMAGRLLEFIAAHGPLELTLIVVTAGAGLSLGHALVAASDRPRREAAAEAGRHALVVLVGCLPWFLVLGLVEGVVSPSPALPPSLKAALGAGLVSLFTLTAAGALRRGGRRG